MVTGDFMLTPQERRDLQLRRRRILIASVSGLFLLAMAVLVAKPARKAILSWQARRHAQRAFTFIDQQKWREARDEATAAYQLQPNEPQAVRAVARFLSRAGQ